MKRRPHRPNQSLSTNRSLKALKTIYWTTGRLQKLLRSLVRNDREEWFAARIQALKRWPDRTKEQIIDDASRVNPRRLMGGRWSWPKSELAIQQELLRSAPEDGIDIDALRKALAELSTGAGAELVGLIADSEILLDTTVPLETGLPQPKEIGTPLLRRIRRLHNKLMANLAGDPDGDLARGGKCEVPRATLRSPAGWFPEEGTAGSQVSRKEPRH